MKRLGKGLESMMNSSDDNKGIKCTKRRVISDEECNDLFITIKNYITERFGGHVEYTQEKSRFFYKVDEVVDISIRYQPVGYIDFYNCIAIAGIQFYKQKRQGNGTQFIKFLCTISEKFSISHIVIENVNDESSALARSLGFTKTNNVIDTMDIDILTLKGHI